uniref:DUS-like FMN-binding domain-containing protein n=1 Tax=Arcella intermedia TaxID=1963864 RepID=A0A6B2L863_9EUKA
MEAKRREVWECRVDRQSFQMDYNNKVILAPMVRVGTLPMRLLALHYGADIVFGEEIVDKALLSATRTVNDALDTIDFVRKDQNLLYRTCQADFPNVFQLGTNNAVNALQAASVVSRDVCGIDVNMGCPKHFSVHSGMGAALLSNPESIKDILSTLKRNLNIPVSCKIRLKSTINETIDVLKLIESTGVQAVTVHCRTIPERPKDKAHWEIMKEIIALKPISIPIILNGDVFNRSDILKVKEETGVTSVMIARGAIKNASIFQDLPLPIFDVMKQYMKFAILTDNHYTNTKYNLQYFAKENNIWENNGEGEGKVLYKGKHNRLFASMLNLEEFYDQFQAEINSLKGQNENHTDEPPKKKKKAQ